MKGLLLIAVSIIVLLMIVLWSSLFKSYPVEGKKQLLAINSGDTYSGFIDRLAKEDMASFPIILKLYQKIFIHDTLSAVFIKSLGIGWDGLWEILSSERILKSSNSVSKSLRTGCTVRTTKGIPIKISANVIPIGV